MDTAVACHVTEVSKAVGDVLAAGGDSCCVELTTIRCKRTKKPRAEAESLAKFYNDLLQA